MTYIASSGSTSASNKQKIVKVLFLEGELSAFPIILQFHLYIPQMPLNFISLSPYSLPLPPLLTFTCPYLILPEIPTYPSINTTCCLFSVACMYIISGLSSWFWISNEGAYFWGRLILPVSALVSPM